MNEGINTIMLSRIMGALTRRRTAIQDEDREGGFTLIELLVVVIIIGILAAIAIPVYLGVQNSAKDNAVKSDLTSVKTALLAYQVQNPGTYTTDLSDLSSTIEIDPSNYASTGALKIETNSSTGFCIDATASTGTKLKITDSSQATDGALC